MRGDGTDFADSAPPPGDRAPDVPGLRRHNVGFPLRLFDILRGTDHVLVAHLPGAHVADRLADFAAFTKANRAQWKDFCRVVAIVPAEADDLPNVSGIAVYKDADGAFAATYGAREAAFLIRPDGYLGWRGKSWRATGLVDYWSAVFAGIMN